MNVFAEGQGGLGAGNGLGFGWRDMTIYKLGLVHRYDSRWTFRGGLSYGTQPIPASEVTLNIMAPAVIEKHLAAGCSYRLPGSMGGEVIFTYNHALENDVTGDFAQAFGGTPGAAQTRLEMDQNTFDIGYTRYF
jgi:long-chain fatty acid transport protein